MENCEIASALRAPYSTSISNPARSQGRGRQSIAPIFRNMSLRSQLLAACAIFTTATPALAQTNIINTHSVSEVNNGTVNPVFDSGTIIVSASNGATQTLTPNLTVMTEGGVFSVDRFVTLTALGNITDYTGMSGTIYKTGTGTLILAGTNSYTGGTLVLAGLLTGTTTSLQGAIRNEDKVEFKQATAGTYASIMTGGGQLIKNGVGTVTLTGANSYTGGTLISQGKLIGTTTSLQGAISGSGTVEFSQDTNGTYAGVISGTLSFEKLGDGTVTLTGANSYSEGTIISGGRLVGNTMSLQGDIFNFRELEFAQDTDGTYAGEMRINGTLIKSGAGALTLTGENSFDGGTLVSAGRLTASTTSLEGDIINGAIVEFAQASDGSYTDEMSGTGQFIKTGAGTLTLRGANSYTGGTLVSAGRLAGNTTSLQGDIANNAQVEFVQNGAGVYADVMSGTGQLIKSGTYALTLSGANSYSGGTVIQGRLIGDTTSLQGAISGSGNVEFRQNTDGTYAGAMSGTIALDKIGAGTLTLTGANSYTGRTNVIAGRLVGNTTSLQGDIFSLTQVEFAQASDGTYASAMSGSGQLIKTGGGDLTLTGAHSYTGGTLVSQGRLLGNTSSLQGAIINNAKVLFAQTGVGTYAGTISGTGQLIKSGVGTLSLTGANTYSGGTLVWQGKLIGDTTSLQGDVVNNAQVEFAQADFGAYAGAMSGTGQFIKTDFGTLILTGANSYSGGTVVLDGRLVGDTTSLQGDIVSNVEIEFAQSTDGTYAGAMSGSGALVKTDAGTLTLTGANSYTGSTLVLDGRLVGNTTSLQGDVSSSAVVEFAQDIDGSYTGRMSGNGQLIKAGAGTLTLTGANRYTGGTTVSAGRLAGNTSSLKGAIVNNAELEFAQATNATYAGVVSGTGQLIKTGAGTLTLTGAHSYSGGTFVSGGRLVGNTTALRGDIVNNAAVEFAEPDSGTYAGAMSGSGQLIKTGYGLLTLGGANSYTGGTAVTGGTLIGNTTSLQGAIVNDGAVQFAQDTDGTYAGIMSGSGALVKAGAGTLTLTGANSYTGTTLVAAGRLAGDTTSLQGDIYSLSVVEFAQSTDGLYAGEMSGSGSLVKTGAGTLTLTGAHSYSGGTLVVAGRLAGSTMSLLGDVTNDAELEFAQVADGSYAGVVSGTGQLVKTGAGTLVLTGANSYTGGTLVAVGRLTGNAMSLKGAIVNEAVVEFAQSNAGTYAGAVSGNGALVKTGAGTLTLTGAHSYSGGTLVSAGRLAGDTTSLQGAIVNDAAVEFAQGTDGTYSGDMGGSGAFYKSGAGTLTLAGITSITGAATVSAGRLKVAGQLAADSVTVRTTATLSGTGVIGGNVVVQSGGSLAPGASPGTLSVIGNVSFLAGSNFGVEIDGATYNPAGGAGSYDLLQISGVANLAGTITPTLRGITGAATNSYVPSIGESFLVLSAATITGSFSDVAQPAGGLPTGIRFDAIYGGDSVRLVVTPDNFAALGSGQDWNRNGSNAASGIDSARLAVGVRSGASQTLFNGIYGMNADQLETVFSQISGEIYASSLQSATETERSTFSSVFNALCDSSCGVSDRATNVNRSVWGRYISKSANHAEDQFASGYNSSSSGLLMGASLTDSNLLQFGVAASYVQNKVATSLGASTDTNSTGGYLYLNYTPADNFNVSSVLGVSVSKTHVSRSIGTTAGRVNTNSDTKNMTVMYGAKASYRGFADGPLSLWADVGVELSDTSSAKIDERAVNTDFALVLGKVRHRSAETQMSARLQLTSDDAQISLLAGSVYELGDHPSMLRNVELGAAKWTVRSADKQRHGIRLGMQSCAQLSKRVSLSATYQHTNQGNGYTYDRANVGLNFAF